MYSLEPIHHNLPLVLESDHELKKALLGTREGANL